MTSEEYLYILALKQCKNIGNINLKKLIKNFGSAKKVWESSPRSLLSTSGIGKHTIQNIGNEDLLRIAEKEIALCKKQDIKIISQNDDLYPKHLLNCDDSPVLLFYKGNLNPDRNSISMVGTRKMTSYGKNFIQDLLSGLSNSKISTISGLALGVDSCVHEESLKNQIPTIAVLAQGLSTIYPAKNKALANKILENEGALVTEYASFEGMAKENFLQRNRIIAGFSPNLIVVETAYGGGSVTTVNFANQYNRDVYALPGKITDVFSQGCNQLISLNKAETIVDINTLIKNLNFLPQPELFPKEKQKVILDSDKKEHQMILDIIEDNESISLDDIAEKSGILHHKLLPILLDLEIYGHIKCLSGRQYLINQ
ncbi:DNA-processing protein DprA [Epilithonimonas hungarica]|uniref:DNA processing protein n=1 Tax=Epilithonimonas hungarica TaxID=454006 RepID=A0A1G7FH08_9FLAO|nr:DNA-processing protein DprA [Epilithonimonas hungarica]MDP9957221.1 DNA processing protein [Epilithonimonas hungarica]SDE75107.1 DNA processing protein [Epilithonimonas hungarica]